MRLFSFLRMAVYVGMGLYVFLAFFNIIQLSQPFSLNMSFGYPPSPSGVLHIANSSEFMFIQLEVSANQTIAERVPVALDAKGSIGRAYAKSVISVTIGFDGAYPYMPGMKVIPIGGPFSGATLHVTNTPVKGLALGLGGNYLVGDKAIIEWHVQGDYYPAISVVFMNGTIRKWTYQEYHVHVESASATQMERLTHIGMATGVALVVFALTDARDIFKSTRKKGRDKKDRVKRTF